jgi:AraC-like DNA-binding protein
LTDLALPVANGGRHVATLWSGQVFSRAPSDQDFVHVLKRIGGEWNDEVQRQARREFFAIPVVVPEKLHAVATVLEVFAAYLAQHVGEIADSGESAEPPAVIRTRRFVEEKFGEPLTLPRIARHAHMSRFYLCRLFKKTTGVTLTQFIVRIRLEKATRLLAARGLRITEVAAAAGFGSLPRFNSVFKQHMGMSPTEYRSTNSG